MKHTIGVNFLNIPAIHTHHNESGIALPMSRHIADTVITLVITLGNKRLLSETQDHPKKETYTEKSTQSGTHNRTSSETSD